MTSPQEANDAGRKLIKQWPHANPHDPLGYAMAIGAVFGQYPLGLVQECIDPRVGLARTREFPPTVACIVEWCDKRLTYHRGMARYQPPPTEHKFSEEHERNMLVRLKGLFSAIWSREPQPEAAE